MRLCIITFISLLRTEILKSKSEWKPQTENVFVRKFQLDTKYYTAIVEFLVIVKPFSQNLINEIENFGPFVDAFLFVFQPQNVRIINNYLIY
jgi:hypothetical protein